MGKINKKSFLKTFLIIGSATIVSFALGIIFKDYIWGPLTLLFGFLSAYYMAIGKWENYLYGILVTITYTYICTLNGLYGWLIFSILLYLPVQIYGIINWSKNKKENKVKIKSFTIKNSILI